MKHILIFEISLEGHHSVYLYHIASAYLEAGFFVTVTILEECQHHHIVSILRDRFPDKIDFRLIYPGRLDYTFRSLGGNVGKEIANWLMFRRMYLEVHNNKSVNYVFFPYLDYCLYVIGLFGLPCCSTPWSGICMQTTIHHSKYRFLSPIRRNHFVRKAIFLRLLKHSALRKMLTIDELLFQFVVDEYPDIGSCVEYLADPTEAVGNHTQSSARNVLSIPQNAFVILVYGSISLRKGLDALVRAVGSSEIPKTIHLLIVGKQQDSISGLFLSDDMVALSDLGRVHIMNKFVDAESEQMVFAASDVVWLGYRGHFAMSGVLVLAAKARRVIIATRYGLIGWHTRVKRLGITVDVEDISSVKDALIQLADPETLSNYQRKMTAEFAEHTWENAVGRILKATPVF